MTETYGSFVHQAHGSVHSGEGNQYNLYYMQAAESRLRRQAARRPQSIAEEDRRHVAERFVPPTGLQQARARLRDAHTVLIDGLPGSGRRTAALMLLHELPETHGSLHELPDTSDDRRASPLDESDVNDGDRLLLDLSEVEESRYVAVQNALSDFRHTVIERGARLVVVLPHHLGYLRRDELRRLTVELGRPSAKRVLTVHLKRENIMPSPEELGASDLTAFLAQAPMRDVAALADRIRRCRDVSPADRGFPDWLADSLDDQHDQTARVAADLSAGRSGRERALLLSLAMFHEATPDVVLQAANALLGTLSHPPDTTPRLDRVDLHTELSAIGADTGPDDRVRFRVAGYDRAVRAHFWTFLPDIRRQLRDWFRDCLPDRAISSSVREAAVARFAAESLRTDRPEDLTWLAERWMSGSGWARLVPEAAQTLAEGLNDDRHGRFFRQRIYDWATSVETSDRLRQVLIVVCSQTMARSHPDQALVRLHHLARRSNGSVGTKARQALLDLTRSDDRLYRQMLDRLGAGIGQGQWEADRSLFLELADPARLIGYRGVREPLAVCWAGVLRRPVSSWTVPVKRWFTACEDMRYRDLVLRVLATACASDTRVSGRLYRVGIEWLHTKPNVDRTDTVSLLLRKINAAQGIEPYEYAV
ncbi:hypothetical protein GCM10027074_21400 [Streptomyces deserti]